MRYVTRGEQDGLVISFASGDPNLSIVVEELPKSQPQELLDCFRVMASERSAGVDEVGQYSISQSLEH